MKTKLMILSAALLLTVTGCGNDTAAKPNNGTATGKAEIKLTQEEIAGTGENANAGAQLLVRKAVIKEMEGNKYTPEEQKELDNAIENLKVEFFLNRTASKNVVVTDEEVLATYKENGDKLKNADIEIVFPQIKQEIFMFKVNNEKVAYMNSLVEKYKLNDRIKEYYKLEEPKAEEPKAAEAPKPETPAPAEPAEDANTEAN